MKNIKLPTAALKSLSLKKDKRNPLLLALATLLLLALAGGLYSTVYRHESAEEGKVRIDDMSARIAELKKAGDCEEGIRALSNVTVDHENTENRILFHEYRIDCLHQIGQFQLALESAKNVQLIYSTEGVRYAGDEERVRLKIQSIEEDIDAKKQDSQDEALTRETEEYDGPYL